MSSLYGSNSYERSSLPPEDQLDLHVESSKFLSLMQQIEPENYLIHLDTLAEAFHQVFCDGLRKQGIIYGPVTDNSKKIHSSLLPFDDLPNIETNRHFVREVFPPNWRISAI